MVFFPLINGINHVYKALNRKNMHRPKYNINIIYIRVLGIINTNHDLQRDFYKPAKNLPDLDLDGLRRY